jgi:hypothetical protein
VLSASDCRVRRSNRPLWYSQVKGSAGAEVHRLSACRADQMLVDQDLPKHDLPGGMVGRPGTGGPLVQGVLMLWVVVTEGAHVRGGGVLHLVSGGP